MEVKAQYLLYDENCPLCVWYTRLFVKYGFIQNETRMSYQQAIQQEAFSFDEERAKSEIALVTEGESTTYGIDSMLKVMGSRWSLVRVIGHFLPIYWMLQMLYRFISFNRKIIAPTVCKDNCSCTPKFHPFWRATFIVFCGVMTYWLVGNYFNSELSSYLKNDHFSHEFTLFVAQLLFQAIVFKALKQRDVYTYLGHLSFISLLGALVLGGSKIVLSTMSSFGLETALLSPVIFGVVVALMLVEHIRRVKLLGLSSWLTVSLLIFRILIYPIVFTL